jgi:hypothetical protein
MRAHVLALALVAVPSITACDDLSPMQSGVCGNRVIDPGEDCDTFATQPGTVCRPPGSLGACRFACGPQTDGTSAVCPTGTGCGVDGTCRAPNGSFAAPTQPIPGAFSEILAGDVDGDGRADVVAAGPIDYSVRFFDDMLAVSSTFQSSRGGSSVLLPILRSMTGSGRADLLDSVAGGTLINLGGTDRTFQPTAASSVTVHGISNVRVIALKALPATPGDQLMAMGSVGAVSALAVLDSHGQGQIFAILPASVTMVAGPVAVGRFDEDPVNAPCDELALAFAGGTDVLVYRSCKPDGMGGFGFNTGATPTTVKVASAATVERGPLVLDINGDGHLDLVVGASSCSGCHEIEVAYGVGDGTFHSDPKSIPPTMGDETFSVYPFITGALPLALGDLNGDGIPDQVTASQVLVSAIGPGATVTFAEKAANPGAPWTEAVIADLNKNGIPDVFAGSSQAPNVSFFNGVGDGAGTLDPFTIMTHAPVAHFIVDDFDGDLVKDVALAELASGAETLGDSMSVLFGRAVGAPDPPIGMGQFVGIQEIVSGRFNHAGLVSGVDDLLSSSVANGTTVFGAFAGRGDRVLRSALYLGHVDMTGISESSPVRYAVGSFPTATGPRGVAILGTQSVPPPPKGPIYRVWLIPSDGVGRIATQVISESDVLLPVLDWSNAAMGAVDLDGDGVDELVVLGPAASDTSHGVLAIAHVEVPGGIMPGDTSRIFVFGTPATIDSRVSRDEAGMLSASQTGRLRVADIDGDGHLDVVALATIADPAGGAPSPHVVVFWNDNAAPLQHTTVIPNPAGTTAVDFALLGVDGTAKPRVALLTGTGVFFADFAARSATAAASAMIPASGQRLIAAGDVDGDGVDDLVLADGAGFAVYHGQAVRP